ncbi:HEPN domain-containing protein [Roseitranquillus sediminis]|uniref:hypothetical protein n=1 Tax=Roseitranquillus sediminis TaxID=2809051 RepID=UPI001D0CA039|nr:hypothetical protein [Roseitranquillus sediminis]MBM9595499.1 hypothetical protein [Roseitranquillus sediminis]
MEERSVSAIAVFNYAHSYASSANALGQIKVEASHWNAPVYYLYFHAIELYLKAYLVAHGRTLEDLRKRFSHRVRALAEEAKPLGLRLRFDDEEAIRLMADTDNVISARYIRIGTHTRLPFSSYAETCIVLHEQVGPRAYEGSGITRIPVLELPEDMDWRSPLRNIGKNSDEF